jgi:hypothetical protein
LGHGLNLSLEIAATDDFGGLMVNKRIERTRRVAEGKLGIRPC